MKRLLGLLIGLCIYTSVFAQAQTDRWAIFLQQQGTPDGERNEAILNILRKNGTQHTVFNADCRTWGEAGTDDSLWFRQHGYTAILIPCEDGQQSGTPVRSGPWGTNFKNAAGVASVGSSPLSGRWGMITGAAFPKRIVADASYNDTTLNNFVAGITFASPVGSFSKPNEAGAGTWRYRGLCRLDGDKIDTLYYDSNNFVCRPTSSAPWAGAGSISALVFPDSVFASCTGSDTVMSMWRFRPKDNVPGIIYSVFNTQHSAGVTYGDLLLLQYLYKQSKIYHEVIQIPVMEHDTESGALNETSYVLLERLHDFLRVNNVNRTIFTPMHPTNEYPILYTSRSLDIIRTDFNSKFCKFGPFSYDAAAGEWTFRFYNASDTAGVRSRWNQLYNTMTRSDSAGFSINAYNVSRVVTASGEVGVWQGKVLADAGVKIIESTFTVPDPNGWVFQVPTGNFGGTNVYNIPGTGETRTINVQGTSTFLHTTTYSALRGAVAPYEYVGRTWINNIGVLARGNISMYWHTGGANSVTVADPYYIWLLGIALKQFKFIDQVVQLDRTFINQTKTPRNTYTSRY